MADSPWPESHYRSPLSKTAALLLCWYLGTLGAHRFYCGKIGTGVAMVLTLGGLGLWTLADFTLICLGRFKDAKGWPIARPCNLPAVILAIALPIILVLAVGGLWLHALLSTPGINYAN
jgi:hypothetical protein